MKLCSHSTYNSDGHCSEMACDNYVNKCPLHSIPAWSSDEEACSHYGRSQSDRDAMSQIHLILDGKEWSPETLDEIAEIVTSTGRKVREP